VVLSIVMSGEDFAVLVGAFPASTGGPDQGRFLRALRWDTETANLVRAVDGSILVRITDEQTLRQVLLSPGGRHTAFDQAGGTVSLSMADFVAISSGAQHPTDLFFSGRVQISGDAEIALALGGLFV
jgi:predicted lipid carrier protein YhbT